MDLSHAVSRPLQDPASFLHRAWTEVVKRSSPHLVHGAAEHGRHVLVDVRGPSLGVEDPDTLEDGVDEPAVPFLGFAELRLRTPQPEQRLDRRQQLVRIDGMRQITIGATLQAVHLVAGGTIGRGEVEHVLDRS